MAGSKLVYAQKRLGSNLSSRLFQRLLSVISASKTASNRSSVLVRTIGILDRLVVSLAILALGFLVSFYQNMMFPQ